MLAENLGGLFALSVLSGFALPVDLVDVYFLAVDTFAFTFFSTISSLLLTALLSVVLLLGAFLTEFLLTLAAFLLLAFLGRPCHGIDFIQIYLAQHLQFGRSIALARGSEYFGPGCGISGFRFRFFGHRNRLVCRFLRIHGNGWLLLRILRFRACFFYYLDGLLHGGSRYFFILLTCSVLYGIIIIIDRCLWLIVYRTYMQR